ncbi:interferon gamma receptor 2 isoform X3 [Engystomops pustulosus]|uniref:interferon gamma receptor 2 isoform X3 n=1 Tax=Engystomops pustulosus TaxID=76066 RepID=UPI003AFA6BC7
MLQRPPGWEEATGSSIRLSWRKRRSDNPLRTFFRARFSDKHPMCVNITETQCDFTDKVKPFWRGHYMVRAELGEQYSSWVQVSDFQASKHTKIGPVQSLVVQPHAKALTVDFSPPFPSEPPLRYLLYYWKEGAENKAEVPLRASTHYLLGDLEEETEYCVQVQAFTSHIEGEISNPLCAKTKIGDYTGKEVAVTVGCVTVVCLICSVAGFMIYRNKALLKGLLYPPFRMPVHIHEFLENPSAIQDEAGLDSNQERLDSISILELTIDNEDNRTCDDPNLVEKT